MPGYNGSSAKGAKVHHDHSMEHPEVEETFIGGSVSQKLNVCLVLLAVLTAAMVYKCVKK